MIYIGKGTLSLDWGCLGRILADKSFIVSKVHEWRVLLSVKGWGITLDHALGDDARR